MDRLRVWLRVHLATEEFLLNQNTSMTDTHLVHPYLWVLSLIFHAVICKKAYSLMLNQSEDKIQQHKNPTVTIMVGMDTHRSLHHDTHLKYWYNLI